MIFLLSRLSSTHVAPCAHPGAPMRFICNETRCQCCDGPSNAQKLPRSESSKDTSEGFAGFPCEGQQSEYGGRDSETLPHVPKSQPLTGCPAGRTLRGSSSGSGLSKENNENWGVFPLYFATHPLPVLHRLDFGSRNSGLARRPFP